MLPCNYNKLLNAADKLITVEDEVEQCQECFAGNWCLKHAQQHSEAIREIRVAIGRQEVKK